MPRQSLLEYLEYFARYGSDAACVHRRGYRQARWTYRQIADGAAQFARELESRGIQPDDRIILWGDNCAEWIVAFWGTLLRGAVVVPMDRIAAPEFAARVAQQVDAKLLVSSRELMLPGAIIAALSLDNLSETISRYGCQADRPAAVSRSEIAEIIFTSGTTAEPKGVVLTHGNILANLEQLESEIAKYRRYERIFHPLRFLNLLPLSHVFGQFMGLFVPPLIGATVLFLDTLNPSEVVRTCKRERVSVLVAVPRMLDSLKEKLERDLEAKGRLEEFQRELAAAERERYWWRIWRFRRTHRMFGWKFWAFVSGGAKLEDKTEDFWRRLGFAVIQGYGSTETASLISLNNPFRAGPGSIGRSLAGREVKLGEDGEILVRGESIAAGYWRGQELEPVADADGWFRTGDLGGLDEQGNLYFRGRKKNLIVTAAGMKIHPEDLETALRRQPEVCDCVVLGVARNSEEEPCAVLILRVPAEPAAIVQRANESLAEFQRIRLWQVWAAEDFPRTSTGKPRVHLIREAVETQIRTESAARSGTPAATMGAELPTPLESLIERITGRSPGKLSLDANLQKDLNLSSLDRVELLSALEDRFETDLSESRFSAASTVGELEQLLRQPAAASSPYPYPRWPQWGALAVLRSLVYYLLVWPATMILARPRVEGREHLRSLREPALFIANHVTEKDIGFVLAALPHRYRYRLATAMNGERLRDLRHPPAGRNLFLRCVDRLAYVAVCAFFNVFPMPKQSGVRASFQVAGESVDRGQSILVFPEGQLTPDGGLSAFRAGIGVLAKTLQIPVVPIRIDGLFELRQAGKRLARPGTVRVRIGEPQQFDAAAEPEAIACELQKIIESMGEQVAERN
ncbi:MAG: AMP-binding protein [Acidobacteria bacterium]|nr:AMP-binding protein [Acidobacteriota bacterium]